MSTEAEKYCYPKEFGFILDLTEVLQLESLCAFSEI